MRDEESRWWAVQDFYGVITGTLYAEAFKLPQFIGAQLAHNWIPDEWVSTTGRAILSNETNPELGTVAHPRLSIPVEWPEDSPIPQLTGAKKS